MNSYISFKIFIFLQGHCIASNLVGHGMAQEFNFSPKAITKVEGTEIPSTLLLETTIVTSAFFDSIFTFNRYMLPSS